jgi:hypothetical protein
LKRVIVLSIFEGYEKKEYDEEVDNCLVLRNFKSAGRAQTEPALFQAADKHDDDPLGGFGIRQLCRPKSESASLFMVIADPSPTPVI